MAAKISSSGSSDPDKNEEGHIEKEELTNLKTSALGLS